MDIFSPRECTALSVESSYNIGFIRSYTVGSCALNKKGCHFPAAPTGNPSHTRRVSRKLRAPPRPPLFARANFSRLNFDSGAKILRDIIKYDYPAKVEEKKETARGDASREV